MDLIDFSQHLRDRDRAPSTIAGYCREVERFAQWFHQTNGQALTPAGFTGRDVRDYREYMQIGRTAPGTINQRLTAVRSYGAWLALAGQVQSNPAENVKLVEVQPLAPRSLDRRQLASLERELERTVNAASTEAALFLRTRDRAIVLLLANSGLRVAELCALEMADLALSERAGSVTVRRGKGNKLRSVPLNVEARRPLAAWLSQRSAMLDSLGAVIQVRALFCDWGCAPLRPWGVQHMLRNYGRRAGVEVTPHTLRHTFAKGLADAGVRAEEIAALLGHSKLETTR